MEEEGWSYLYDDNGNLKMESKYHYFNVSSETIGTYKAKCGMIVWNKEIKFNTLKYVNTACKNCVKIMKLFKEIIWENNEFLKELEEL